MAKRFAFDRRYNTGSDHNVRLRTPQAPIPPPAHTAKSFPSDDKAREAELQTAHTLAVGRTGLAATAGANSASPQPTVKKVGPRIDHLRVSTQEAGPANTSLRSAAHANGELQSHEGTARDAPARGTSTCYSLAGVPVLDAEIPLEFLPNSLLVYDEDSVVARTAVRYVRVEARAHKGVPFVYPARRLQDDDDDDDSRDTPRLLLPAEERSLGGHSTVIRAALELRGGGARGRVRVVAKVPGATCGAFWRAHQEARMYGAFPRELAREHMTITTPPPPPPPPHGVPGRSQHLNSREEITVRGGQVPVVSSDVGAARSEGADESTALRDARAVAGPEKEGLRSLLRVFSTKKKKKKTNARIVAVTEEAPSVAAPLSPNAYEDEDAAIGAPPSARDGGRPDPAPKSVSFPPVVPKFYGYYLPLRDDGRVWFEVHGACGEGAVCGVDWPAPILLMEDCGSPVQPWLFTRQQRLECFALVKFLHDAGFVHETAYEDGKMVVQPGPLCVPRAQRSYRSPSFRLVGFGCGLCRGAGVEEDFAAWCEQDYEFAWRALALDGDERAAP